MNDLGKILIFTGAILVLAGFFILLVGKMPGVGKLPGDIFIKKENFTFYFPVTTSLLISIALSFLLFLWMRK